MNLNEQRIALLQDLQRELEQAKARDQRIEGELAKLQGQDPLQREADTRLEDEVFATLRSAKYPRAAIGAIARGYGYRPEAVEEIASRVFLERLGKEYSECEYEGMVEKMKLLEERCKDPGFKAWQIQTMAKRYGRTPSQLTEAYTRALINQPKLQPQTLAELRAETGDSDWIINGWLIRGTTVLLHADGGTGKTLFAYNIAASLVKGTPWQGYPCQKSKVLLVQLDEPKEATVERLELMGFPDDILIERNWQAENLPQLAPYIEEHRPDFIIVDSLTAINRNTCFSENDVEYARPILHLADLASRYGCTVLLIHHSSAAGKARGTTAIRNSVSEVWHLKHHNQFLQQLALTVEKTRMGRQPGSYQFDFDPDGFGFTYRGELQGETVIESNGTQQERIRLWLSETSHRGTAYHPREIAEYLQLNDCSARRACHEAWSRALIKRRRAKDGRGYLYYCGDPQLTLTSAPPHPENEPSPTGTSTDQGVSPSDRFPIGVYKSVSATDTQGVQPTTDRAIAKTPQSLTSPEISKNSDRRDRPIGESLGAIPAEPQNHFCSPIALPIAPIAESTRPPLVENATDRTPDRAIAPLSQGQLKNQQNAQTTDCKINPETHPDRFTIPTDLTFKKGGQIWAWDGASWEPVKIKSKKHGSQFSRLTNSLGKGWYVKYPNQKIVPVAVEDLRVEVEAHAS